jgi:hypothetical protein
VCPINYNVFSFFIFVEMNSDAHFYRGMVLPKTVLML